MHKSAYSGTGSAVFTKKTCKQAALNRQTAVAAAITTEMPSTIGCLTDGKSWKTRYVRTDELPL